MKRILSIVFLLCLNFAAMSQWPINQNIGSDSTMVRVGPNKSGGLWGGIVVKSFSDTTAANLTRIRQYEGGMIFTTGDSSFWYRSPGAVKWFKFSSNTVNSSGWNIGGNLFPVLPTPQPNIGTLAPWGGAMGFMTNSVTHLVLPDAGITNNDNDSLRVLVYEPTNTNIRYRTATSFKNIYNSDGTLTGSRLVNLDGNELEVTDNGYDILMLAQANSGDDTWLESTYDLTPSRAQMGTFKTRSDDTKVYTQMTSHYDILDSNIRAWIDLSSNKDSARALYEATYHRFVGNLYAQTVGYTLSTVGKKIMLRDTASGLVQNIDPSLLSVGSVPISGLTAATVANTIDNTNYLQTWQWSTGGSGGIYLDATTTGSADGHKLFRSWMSGANGTSSVDSWAGHFLNSHTGTSSTNYGVYGAGSNATTNYGGDFVGSGGTTAIGIRVSATTGANNYAIIVPSSSGSVGIGTSTPTSLLHVVSPATTGIGTNITSSTITSGSIVDITGTSTSLASGNEALNIAVSGANGTNAITATGARISVTNTNGTSGTNVGLDVTASGATTANNAIRATGNVLVEGTGNYVYGRWRARVDSTTSSATPTINTDNVDVYKLTAQAADITSFTTNLSGTPQDGDILELQITGTAARAITWGASFVSTTVTLPATTVTTATLTVILQYYKSSSYGNNKWHCVNSY